MPTPPLAQDDRLTVMGLLVETWAAVSGRLTGHMASFGLAPAEFEVCIRLARSRDGQLRMSDLAAQTTMSASGVTRVVDRLVERGLVGRLDCVRDRRTTYAVLTARGSDLLQDLLPGHTELIDQWLIEPLRKAGLDEFVRALRAVRDHAAPCSVAGATPADAVPQPR